MVLQPKLVSPLSTIFLLVLKPRSLTSVNNTSTKYYTTDEKLLLVLNGQLGKCELYEVKIQLKEGAKPFRKKPYRLAPHNKKEAQKQIDQYLRDGVLEECDSEYCSPLLVVTEGQKRSHKHMKSDGQPLRYRIVVDLRELNTQIVNTTRLVPNPEELIDRICQRYDDPTQTPKFFTSQKWFSISIENHTQ